MAEVEFEEEWSRRPTTGAASRGSGLSEWLIRVGVARDARRANAILVGVALVALIAAGVIFFTSVRGGAPESFETPPPAIAP